MLLFLFGSRRYFLFLLSTLRSITLRAATTVGTATRLGAFGRLLDFMIVLVRVASNVFWDQLGQHGEEDHATEELSQAKLSQEVRIKRHQQEKKKEPTCSNLKLDFCDSWHALIC